MIDDYFVNSSIENKKMLYDHIESYLHAPTTKDERITNLLIEVIIALGENITLHNLNDKLKEREDMLSRKS